MKILVYKKIDDNGKLENIINHNFASIAMTYYIRLRQYGLKYADLEEVK